MIAHFANGGTTSNLWPAIGQPLMFVQTLAGMEVRCNPLVAVLYSLQRLDYPRCSGPCSLDVFSTVVQLFSRILLADVVAPNVIEAQQH